MIQALFGEAPSFSAPPPHTQNKNVDLRGKIFCTTGQGDEFIKTTLRTQRPLLVKWRDVSAPRTEARTVKFLLFNFPLFNFNHFQSYLCIYNKSGNV